jgi:curved DNA-binding protein
MADAEGFIDYYAILRVAQNCDRKTLEAAYRHLAKIYHPDNSDTADIARFNEVVAAYRILRDAAQRQAYDALYAKHARRESDPRGSEDGQIADDAALNDAEDHTKILLHLYKKRREDAQNAGVIGYYLQEMLQCSDEHFEFHKWYLKEKGFIAITEQGTLAITIQGVDHVISTSRASKVEKLLISQSTNRQD